MNRPVKSGREVLKRQTAFRAESDAEIKAFGEAMNGMADKVWDPWRRQFEKALLDSVALGEAKIIL